jgi:long-chain acyl-CoA synthetase
MITEQAAVTAVACESATLFDSLERFANLTPAHPALIDASTREHVSYGELVPRIESLAERLMGHGVGPDHFVVAFMPRAVPLVEVILAVSRVGGACLPLIAPRSAEQALEIVRDVLAPRLFVYADERAKIAEDAQPGEVWIRYADLVRDACVLPLGHVPREDDPLYVNNTSGSTGRPKLVIASHRHVIANTVACVNALTITAADVHLSTFASHAHDLFARALCTGGTAVLLPDAENPLAVLEALTRYGVTCFMSNVTMYAGLAAFTRGKVPNLQLRLAESGGLPTPEHLQDAVRRIFGARLLPVWGSTETAGVAIAPPLGVRRAHSVGLPLEGYRVEIVRKDGTQAPADEDGELVIAGLGVGDRYLGNTSEQAMLPRLHNGVFHTGDVARRDHDGWIYIRGRLDNRFKVAGVVVNAETIEAALCESPQVSQALVLPVPDPMLGNVPAALLVLQEHQRWSPSVEQQIITDAERRLAEPFFELPHYFKIVSALPRNAVGKIDRQAARQFLPYRQPPHHMRARLKPIKLLRRAIKAARRRIAWRILLAYPSGFWRLVQELWKGEHASDHNLP